MTSNLRTRPLVTLSQAQADVLVQKHEKLNSGVLGGARADFSFHDLSGLNLVNRNLSGTDFTGARLCKTDLAGTRLECASFFAADLRDADLGGALLRRAELRGVCARGANFTGADMFQADLREGAIAERQSIGVFNYLSYAGKNPARGAMGDGDDGVSKNRTGFIAAQADFRDANLTGCNLARANMRNTRLDGAILQGADLSGADLTGASLDGAILCGAKLLQTIILRKALDLALTDAPVGRSAAELERPLSEILQAHGLWVTSGGAQGQPADLGGVDLRKLDCFAGCELTAFKAHGAVFYGLDLQGAALQGAQLMGADLRCADLRGADLRGANLTGARLNYARMGYCNLGPLLLSAGPRIDARLKDACLRYANLSQAQTAGAVFDGADLTGVIGISVP